MKKFLSVFSLGLGLMALVSCNGGTSTPTPDNPSGNSEGKVTYYDNVAKYTDGTYVGDYNLCNSIQDGAILHCWNWSYNTIKANLATIAASGYSAVQTSPVQQSKSSAKGGAWGTEWYKLYQPVAFSIAEDSYLGTKEELQSLCTEAKKYGIKVVVDVVLNHMGNDSTGKGYAEAIETYSPDVWAHLDTYFHQEKSSSIDYGNAYQITHYMLSNLPDLNTANETVQSYALDLLKECIDAGVSGFRFDAAKHIETDLDAEGTKSDFWKNVLGGANQYCQEHSITAPYYYGEILDSPGGNRPFSNYTRYMSVTDTGYSDKIFNLSKSSLASEITAFKAAPDGLKSVVWAESHDTYANANGATKNVSQERLNRIYAVEMSHSGAAALYFARPNDTTPMGKIGTNAWKSDEISAVNNFHNKHLKDNEKVSVQGEYYVCEKNTNAAMIVSLFTLSSAQQMSVKLGALADGTYYDQVTGNQYEVKNGVLSGEISTTGIMVLETQKPPLKPTITVNKEVGYFYESMSVTVNLKNVTEASYTLNNGTSVSISGNSATIEITTTGNTCELEITAKNGTVEASETYTYHKIEKRTGYAAIGGLLDTAGLDYYAWVWYEGQNGHLEEVSVVGDVAYVNTARGDHYLIVCYAKGKDMSKYLSTNNSNDWDAKMGQTDNYTLDENVIEISSV